MEDGLIWYTNSQQTTMSIKEVVIQPILRARDVLLHNRVRNSQRDHLHAVGDRLFRNPYIAAHLQKDPDLKKYPLLREHLEDGKGGVHFE